MRPLACSGLGVLFDTCVFVPCLMQELGFPGDLMEIAREEGLYVVVCDTVFHEYFAVTNRKYAGAGTFVRQRLDSFVKEGLVVWATSESQDSVIINSTKDQHVIDCALNKEARAHFVITNDIEHFQVANSGSAGVLKIVSLKDFRNKRKREDLCRDSKQGR